MSAETSLKLVDVSHGKVHPAVILGPNRKELFGLNLFEENRVSFLADNKSTN